MDVLDPLTDLGLTRILKVPLGRLGHHARKRVIRLLTVALGDTIWQASELAIDIAMLGVYVLELL